MLLFALYVATYTALAVTAYLVGFAHGSAHKGQQTRKNKPQRSYDL